MALGAAGLGSFNVGAKQAPPAALASPPSFEHADASDASDTTVIEAFTRLVDHSSGETTGSMLAARHDPALYALLLQNCHYAKGPKQLRIVQAAFAAAMRACDAAHAHWHVVLNGAASAAKWVGRRLLITFLGDADSSVWSEHFEAQEALFPGEDVMCKEPNFIAGERACAFVFDRCMSGILAALWHLTEPVYGYAIPAPQDVVAAAARVRGIVDVMLPNEAIRRFARWDLSDDACDYLRNEFGHMELQHIIKHSDNIYVESLIGFLLMVRFMRMAIRRARALSPRFVVEFMLDIDSQSAASVDERRWDYGHWSYLFQSKSRARRAPDDALAKHAHACMLPRLTRISDTGQLFPMMYLMRYRTIACELAWIRRSSVVLLRRTVMVRAAAASRHR